MPAFFYKIMPNKYTIDLQENKIVVERTAVFIQDGIFVPLPNGTEIIITKQLIEFYARFYKRLQDKQS